MNRLCLIATSYVLTSTLMLTGCASLVIKDEDDAAATTGKVIARSLLAIGTLFYSEAFMVRHRRAYNMSKAMESWVGHHRDEVVRKWGPPAQETRLSDGGVSMVYSEVWGSSYYTQRGGGGHVTTCRQIFSTDKDLIIRNWDFSGC